MAWQYGHIVIIGHEAAQRLHHILIASARKIGSSDGALKQSIS